MFQIVSVFGMAIVFGKFESRIFGVGKYFHSKSTRPFLITKKGI